MPPYPQANSDPLCRFQDYNNNIPSGVMDESYALEFGTGLSSLSHDASSWTNIGRRAIKASKFGTHIFESIHGLENENNLGPLSAPRYLPSLADDNRGRLWSKTYGDGELNNQDSQILEELSRTIPAVAESLEEFQRVASWVLPCAAIIDNPNMGCQYALSEDPRNARIDRGPMGVATFAASPSRVATYTPQLRHRHEFTCALCGSSYDRMTRARDCQYRDLGLRPYQCEGKCGDSSWLVIIMTY
jgi:hypothetical protein